MGKLAEALVLGCLADDAVLLHIPIALHLFFFFLRTKSNDQDYSRGGLHSDLNKDRMQSGTWAIR